MRVHTVCFHEKIQSEVHLNICYRHKKQIRTNDFCSIRISLYIKLTLSEKVPITPFEHFIFFIP